MRTACTRSLDGARPMAMREMRRMRKRTIGRRVEKEVGTPCVALVFELVVGRRMIERTFDFPGRDAVARSLNAVMP